MKRHTKNIIIVIIKVIIMLLIMWSILGYFNFKKIVDNKEPIYIYQEKDYETNGVRVHIYDNIFYKITKCEGKNISYSLKLWFMEDC